MKNFAVFLLALPLLVSAAEFKVKAFYLCHNMNNTASMPKVEAVIDRAAKAGYNAVHLADAKFDRFTLFGKQYAKNVKRIADYCRAKNLKIIAACAGFGDGNQLLREYPDHAEAAPTKEALYKVQNGKLVPAMKNYIKNGDFSEGKKHWSIPDKEVVIENGTVRFFKKEAKGTQRRICQRFQLKPFAQYRLSMTVRTLGMKPGNAAAITAAPIADYSKNPDKNTEGQYLIFRGYFGRSAKTVPNSEFQEYSAVFNTLGNGRISLYIGAWKLTQGEVQIKNIRLTEGQFVNIVRRSDTPVVVTSVDGKKTYNEGKDFSRITDPLLGREKGHPWGIGHQVPEVKIPAGSVLKEGDTVKVSYYNALVASRGCCFCLHDPLQYKLLERSITAMEKTMHPDAYFLDFDEFRCSGFDPACVKAGESFGEAIGKAAARMTKIVQKIAPGRPIYIWNDMFDPCHNAKPNRWYYLTAGYGGCYGSWKYLPKDLIVADWSGADGKKSMDFFNKLGMKCIFYPGYYTSRLTQEEWKKRKELVEMARKQPNCIGLVFCQWSGIGNFHSLEKAAELFFR